MILTNKHNLPKPFISFAESDKYSRGNADISVTSLIDSPQIRILKESCAKEMKSDIVESVWSMFGSAVHHILESQSVDESVTLEERLFTKVKGWVLSGAVDYQERINNKIHITDYKVTSVYAATSNKPEWERQLNCYAYLIEKERIEQIGSLRICAILRDWNRREAMFKNDYPQAPVMMIDIPLWNFQDREAYIFDRIDLHQEAQQLYDKEGKFIGCSKEETWSRPDVYAVMKGNLKRADKLFKDEDEAKRYIESKDDSSEYEIQFRKGVHIRCASNFCGVSDFCSQYKRS